MKQIWLYGAGDMGRKILKMLCDFDIEVEGFIESNHQIGQSSINGKPIISYQDYKKNYRNRVFIIITPVKLSLYEEIRDRLLTEGTVRENIITKEYAIRTFWKPSEDVFQDGITHGKRNWIIDTGEWGNFGGVEKYTYNLSRLLKRDGENVNLIFPSKIDLIPQDLRESVINYNFYIKEMEAVLSPVYFSNMKEYNDINFCKRVEEAIRILIKQLPFTLILRSPNLWYVAAAFVKDKFPEEVTILNVIHGNESSTRFEVYKIMDDLKAVICSNSGIKKKFQEEGMFSLEEKLIVKWHPIIPVRNKEKSKSAKIRLGYAGRIDIIDKRADLILTFIDELEKYHLDYDFFIAGEGPFEDELKEYIKNFGYTDKIKLLGKIPYDQMHNFWNNMDVFLNFSDTEGFCLSMIEALQSGMACVTTRVHEDIDLFVVNEKNGYVVSTGDMKMMARKVAELIMNPNLIRKFGQYSAEIISEMDDGTEYIKWLKEF